MAFVAALLVIGTFVLWVLALSAVGGTAALGHCYSTGALYAAEGGLEMALRELNQSPPTDTDSDGTIGTISNDGNDATDPALTTGAVRVELVTPTPPTYRATGRPVQAAAPWSAYRRIIEIRTQ